MKNVLIISVILMAFSGNVFAQASVESECYEEIVESKARHPSRMLMRTYIDDSSMKEVGAFVKYGSQRAAIPIVLVDQFEERGDRKGAYQKQWLEIFGGKISGKYILYGTTEGNTQGNYVKYINFSSQKQTSFSVVRGQPCFD